MTGPIRSVTVSAFALLVSSCLSACGADFEPGSKLEKLRLLGLRADQPFARPGEHVSFELLAIDPKQRPLEFAFATCTDPAASTTDACLRALDAPFETVPAAADMPPVLELEVASDALSRLPKDKDAREGALVGAAVVACPGTIESGSTAGVPVRCRDARGRALPITEFELGVKRIFVREHDRNQNPEITAVSWDGKAWQADGEPPTATACSNRETHAIDDCPKSRRHGIKVETRSAEAGEDEYGNRFSEQLVVQVYATAGFFDHDVRIAADADFTWVAQSPANGDEAATLVIVVRDDRGGIAWTTRKVVVR